MRTVRKFFSLAPADRRLIITAGFWVAVIRMSLRLVPFPFVQRMLARFTYRSGVINPVGTEQAERIAWAVSSASRYVFDAACLTQALAAQVLLARSGYRSKVQIGVILGEKGNLQAHAWLESQGKVLIGGGSLLEQFTPLANFEA